MQEVYRRGYTTEYFQNSEIPAVSGDSIPLTRESSQKLYHKEKDLHQQGLSLPSQGPQTLQTHYSEMPNRHTQLNFITNGLNPLPTLSIQGTPRDPLSHYTLIYF